MKIEIEKGIVTLEAETSFDLFNLGQFYSDMYFKNKFDITVSIPKEHGAPYGYLKIKKENFIAYLIKKL